MNELALFAGAGGGILAGRLLGWRTVCAVEIDAFAASVLAQRQNDGLLDPFPVWSDVRTFDGRPWRGIVDVVSGGFPCQDISCAGKGEGIRGGRSGLWSEFARIIREARPRFAFVENVPYLLGRGIDVVLGDLAEGGYDAEWCVLGADDAGAPNIRKRIWILAHSQGGGTRPVSAGQGGDREGARHPDRIRERMVSDSPGHQRRGKDFPGREGSSPEPGRENKNASDSNDAGCEKQRISESANETQYGSAQRRGWWGSEPPVRGMADGMAPELDEHGAAAAGYLGPLGKGIPHRIQRLRCLGNGQVPLTAAMAWTILYRRMFDG